MSSKPSTSSRIDMDDFRVYRDKDITPSIKQEKAIVHRGSPLLLDAAPGTGKTTTIVLRANHFLNEGIPPGDLLILAYNTEVQQEIKRKLIKYLEEDGQKIDVYTYHAKAINLLKQEGLGYDCGIGTDFDVITHQASRMAETALKESTVPGYKAEVDDFLQVVQKMKSTGLSAEEVCGLLGGQRMTEVLEHAAELADKLSTLANRVTIQPSTDRGRIKKIRDEIPVIQAELRDIAPEEPHCFAVGQLRKYIQSLIGTLTAIRSEMSDDDEEMAALVGHVLSGANTEALGQELSSIVYRDRITQFKKELEIAELYLPAFDRYESLQAEHQLYEYDDLVTKAVEGLHNTESSWYANEYQHVFCDEFQDVSAPMFELVRLLGGEEVTFAGDPRQTVYEWRNALKENFTEQPYEVYDEVRKIALRKNHRSRSGIQEATQGLLEFTA